MSILSDLHTHTTASDGQYAPAELVRLAKQHGIQVLAVTDHDTIAGVDEARQAGAALGLIYSVNCVMVGDRQNLNTVLLGHLHQLRSRVLPVGGGGVGVQINNTHVGSPRRKSIKDCLFSTGVVVGRPRSSRAPRAHFTSMNASSCPVFAAVSALSNSSAVSTDAAAG